MFMNMYGLWIKRTVLWMFILSLLAISLASTLSLVAYGGNVIEVEVEDRGRFSWSYAYVAARFVDSIGATVHSLGHFGACIYPPGGVAVIRWFPGSCSIAPMAYTIAEVWLLDIWGRPYRDSRAHAEIGVALVSMTGP